MLIFQREDRQTGNPIVGQVDQKNGQNTSIYALTEHKLKMTFTKVRKEKGLLKKARTTNNYFAGPQSWIKHICQVISGFH